MSAAVKSVAPSHASSKHSSRSSSKASSSHSGANRTVNDVIERIHAAETRSVRPRSHAGSLVLAHPQDPRSVDDINAEIAALEAEARARHLERKAESERELAMSIRAPEYDIVEERQVIRRPREEEIVLFERDRVERRKSPPRNVVRVEKDRKGRMSLVRSSH